MRRPIALALFVAAVSFPLPARSEPPAVPDQLALLAMLEDTRCPDGSKVAAFLAPSYAKEVRARAARALARLQDSTTVEALGACLRHDSDAEVRREAAFALGQVGKRSAYEPLADAFDRDSDPEVKALSLEALGKSGDPRAAAICGTALAGSDPRLAREASIALWRLADSEMVLPLVRALNEDDDQARAMAVWALEKIVQPKTVVPELARRTSDPSPLVRAYVARTLGRQASSLGVEPLVALLGDSDLHVRVNACRALGQVADSTAVPALLARLSDSHPYVREVTVAALGKLRDRSVADRLTAMEQDRAPAVRAAAADALADLLGARDPSAAWLAIRPLLSDRSERVRARAYEALGKVSHPQVIAVLRCVLAGETRCEASSTPLYGSGALEKASAASALGQLKATAARDDLVRALEGRDAGLVASIAEALGELGDNNPQVVTALLGAIERNASPNEPDVVVSGLTTLGKLKAKEAVSLATKELGSTQAPVREAARVCLTSLLGEAEATTLVRQQGPAPWKAVSTEPYKTPGPLARKATLRTARGAIEIELFADDAPLTVANFVRLARSGYFDHRTFHRVVPNFVIQDGDPTGTGWGGPGYSIRCEYNRRRYGVGTVGMALSGKDTGGSQYFITHSPQPHLDGRYTVFGQVTRGLEILDQVQLGDEIRQVVIETPRRNRP